MLSMAFTRCPEINSQRGLPYWRETRNSSKPSSNMTLSRLLNMELSCPKIFAMIRSGTSRRKRERHNPPLSSSLSLGQNALSSVLSSPIPCIGNPVNSGPTTTRYVCRCRRLQTAGAFNQQLATHFMCRAKIEDDAGSTLKGACATAARYDNGGGLAEPEPPIEYIPTPFESFLIVLHRQPSRSLVEVGGVATPD